MYFRCVCNSLGYVTVSKFHECSYRGRCSVKLSDSVLVDNLPVSAGVRVERRPLKLLTH